MEFVQWEELENTEQKKSIKKKPCETARNFNPYINPSGSNQGLTVLPAAPCHPIPTQHGLLQPDCAIVFSLEPSDLSCSVLYCLFALMHYFVHVELYVARTQVLSTVLFYAALCRFFVAPQLRNVVSFILYCVSYIWLTLQIQMII